MNEDPNIPSGAGLLTELNAALIALAGQPQPTGHPVMMPCPPGLDEAKWVTLDRRTRRALWRHHAKQVRRG